MISLAPDYRTTPQHFTPQLTVEVPHCAIHCPNGLEDRGWAESVTPTLPNVRYRLKDLTKKVHRLLHSHMGTLPLTSFQICYEIEIGEKLIVEENGVPLEHLVSCVNGVDVVMGKFSNIY